MKWKTQSKTFSAISFVVVIVISLLSCSDTNDTSYTVVPSVVTDNRTDIASFDFVDQNYQKGDILLLRLNRTGFGVEEVEVMFEATYNSYGERLIFCKTIDGLVVGRGDSGSPLLTQDGKVIGSLCYGFYNVNHQFVARAIDDVLDVGTTVGEKTTSKKFEPIGLSYQFVGVDQEELDKFKKIAPPEFFKNKLVSAEAVSNRQHKYSKSNGPSDFEIPDEIIPGNSISVVEIRGTAIEYYATGTISYMQDNFAYAFGHKYEDLGEIEKPVYLSKMTTLIESSEIAFKYSEITNSYFGMLTHDEFEGIKIDTTRVAQTFTVTSAIEIADSFVRNDQHIVAIGGLATANPSYVAGEPNYSEDELFYNHLTTSYLLYNYLFKEGFDGEDEIALMGSIDIEFEEGGVFEFSFAFRLLMRYDEDITLDDMLNFLIEAEIDWDIYGGHIKSVDFEVQAQKYIDV